MWPFRRRARQHREQPDDAPTPLPARVRQLEADIDDLYDRVARLAGRHARRAQRDAAVEEPAPTTNGGGKPTIAQLRAQGRLPWRP
jgi:hypothetical protein